MPPRLSLEILDQGGVVPSWRGAYQSFPTVTRVGPGHLLVAFRQARVDSWWDRETGDHGSEADIWLADSFDEGRTFTDPRVAVDHEVEGGNEFDALATGLGEAKVLLVTRTHGPEIYSSFWSLSQDGGRTFGPRRPLDTAALGLDLASDQPVAICFGHALPGGQGALLLPFYLYDPPRADQAGLIRLEPESGRLALAGWIWEGELRACGLNETAAVRLLDGRLMALCREEPILSGLHRAFSPDNGRSWSRPEPVDLFGEAPNLIALTDGRLLAIFRGLAQRPGQDNYLGLALSEDQGRTWSAPAVLAEYSGGRYQGGYGDLVQTEGGEVLAVYYLAQSDGEPTLAKSLFKVVD